MSTVHGEPALPTQQVGEFRVQAISDGHLAAPLELLSSIDPADAARLQAQAGADDSASIHINTYLVRGRGRTVLIDAGAGGIHGWGGRLLANLARAGVQPEAIDTVLLTHAHPDHVGGLLDTQGRAVFAHAELVVHPREWAFWQDDGQLARATARAQGNFRLARAVFAAYRAQLRLVDAGEVLPGISLLPLAGHTPGHSGYCITSAAHSALVWGDIVHFPAIQIAHPEVGIAFDQDASLAAATRSRLLDMLSAEGTLIAGMHLDEPGFARLRPRHGGYAFNYEG